MNLFSASALTVTCLLATLVQGFSLSIGINFTGGGNGGSPAISLSPTDSAGVVAQMNWNNFAGGNGTNLALVDSTGATTGALLTFTAGGTYSSIAGAGIAPAGGDEKLNTGFVFGDSSFTLSNIPYALYDVYVYELNDAAGRVETTTLAGLSFFGSSAVPIDASHVDQNPATPYLYTQTVSTTLATPTAGGNYVRYQNLSGNVTLTATAPGNGYVNGLQIVQVPEPASFLLLGCAGVAGAMIRRRTR